MSNRLTLVVFKDHLSSRTLTVRLTWLRAFAFALLSVITLAIISGALFLNAYRKTLTLSSGGSNLKGEELEKELAETKAAYESLKQQALNKVSGSTPSLAGGANSFTALPADAILENLPAPESLAFRLEPIQAQWKGNMLHIKSAIEYSRDDGGNQQGHFIILARGSQAIIAYPEGAFNAAGSPALLKTESGEFFSVSRYREVKADFGPFSKRDDVDTIEIFIFDTRKRLIFTNRIGLESLQSKAQPAAKKNEAAPAKVKAEPKDDSAEPEAAPAQGAPAPTAKESETGTSP